MSVLSHFLFLRLMRRHFTRKWPGNEQDRMLLKKALQGWRRSKSILGLTWSFWRIFLSYEPAVVELLKSCQSGLIFHCTIVQKTLVTFWLLSQFLHLWEIFSFLKWKLAEHESSPANGLSRYWVSMPQIQENLTNEAIWQLHLWINAWLSTFCLMDDAIKAQTEHVCEQLTVSLVTSSELIMKITIISDLRGPQSPQPGELICSAELTLLLSSFKISTMPWVFHRPNQERPCS